MHQVVPGPMAVMKWIEEATEVSKGVYQEMERLKFNGCTPSGFVVVQTTNEESFKLFERVNFNS